MKNNQVNSTSSFEYELIEDKLECISSELATIEVENHPEAMGEIERIRDELECLLEIYTAYEETRETREADYD